MKILVQVVSSAKVEVNGALVSEIKNGLCLLVGIDANDTEATVERLTSKILRLKLFHDEQANWRRSVVENNLEILCVSQFTLLATLEKKPDFRRAMKPDQARELYDTFLAKLRSKYKAEMVKDGRFREIMKLKVTNDGPITFILE